MTYFDGFLIPVPANDRSEFLRHASTINPAFLEYGATRVVECWEDDLKPGHTTDFYRAVEKTPAEVVAFSWVEWPDKSVRDEGMAKMNVQMKDDPRWDPAKNPIPFDGKRMIFGGFSGILERGESQPGSYIQGFVVPVPDDRREDYTKMAEHGWPLFQEYGALRHVEAWGDDVPHGKQTDFYRTVRAEPGESIVFSFIEWPSREICDEASEKMQNDERMAPPDGMTMPFDGKRMIWGGFTPVYELGE